MRQHQKTLLYFVVYFLLFQAFIPYISKSETVYGARVDYDLIKDNPMNIDAPIDQIARIIKKRNLNNYIILIGDSVGYGTPCPPDQIISTYLEDKIKKAGKNIPVFNLSLPANQTGDIYTILLKLKEKKISLEHLIINITYAGFVERAPDPSPVFWFHQELKRLDKASYQEFADLIKKNQYQKQNIIQESLFSLKSLIYRQLPMMIYKDYLKKQFFAKEEEAPQEPLQSWDKKDFLKDLIQEEEYAKGFSDKPFDMSKKNSQIYFINKIMEVQEGKNTLFFLAGSNAALLEPFMTEGYKQNIAGVQDYFAENSKENFDYIDFNGKIEDELYSDHVHLLPKGYEQIADTIFFAIQDWPILR